jgi:hypothetical protein
MSLHIKKVASDGNCLVNAVAYQIENSSPFQLRQALYEEYRNNWEQYTNFIENPILYADKIKKNGVWLDEIDISVLAKIIGADIELYIGNLETPPFNVYHPTNKKQNTIVRIIYVNDNHYNAVVITPDSPHLTPSISPLNIPVLSLDTPYCENEKCTVEITKECNSCYHHYCAICMIQHVCNFREYCSVLECDSVDTEKCDSCYEYYCQNCNHKCHVQITTCSYCSRPACAGTCKDCNDHLCFVHEIIHACTSTAPLYYK